MPTIKNRPKCAKALDRPWSAAGRIPLLSLQSLVSIWPQKSLLVKILKPQNTSSFSVSATRNYKFSFEIIKTVFVKFCKRVVNRKQQKCSSA